MGHDCRAPELGGGAAARSGRPFSPTAGVGIAFALTAAVIDRESLFGLDEEALSLALAILEYLERNPKAMDTAEGIAMVWLPGVVTEDKVRDVVIELVARGLIRQMLKPDGGWIYGGIRDQDESAPTEADENP